MKSKGLSPITLAAIKTILDDPDFDIREDGTVWRRVGKPDKNGIASVGTKRTGDKQTRQAPVHLLVWAKFRGTLPNYATERINFKDGDPLNTSLSNLVVTNKNPFRGKVRDRLTVAEERKIKEELKAGIHPRTISRTNNTTIQVVREIEQEL
jgi:hypothetical protein